MRGLIFSSRTSEFKTQRYPGWTVIFVLFVVILGWSNSLRLVLASGNDSGCEKILCIDQAAYVRGMEDIVQNNRFILIQDLMHSPGYQLFLAGLFKIYPFRDRIFVAVHWIQWVLFVISTCLLIYWGETYAGKWVGFVAGVLLATSQRMVIYVSLVQYEVLLMFLILLLVCLMHASLESRSMRRQCMLLSASAVIVSAVVLIHSRFLPLVPLMGVCVYLRRSGQRKLIPVVSFLTPFLLIFGGWVFFQYQWGQEGLVIGQTGLDYRFQLANNPHAQGYAWPYAPIGQPSGFEFILKQPERFLWLVKERLLYLWDIKHDVWYLQNGWVRRFSYRINSIRWDVIYYLFSLGLFLLGVVVSAFKVHRDFVRVPPFLWPALVSAFVVPLLFLSSSRFLIPVLPLMYLVQAVGVVVLARIMGERMFR